VFPHATSGDTSKQFIIKFLVSIGVALGWGLLFQLSVHGVYVCMYVSKLEERACCLARYAPCYGTQLEI